MVLSLIFQGLKMSSKTSFTDTKSWFESWLQKYTYLFSPGSTTEQWREYCFPEKSASWTSCFCFDARFSEKSSSIN